MVQIFPGHELHHQIKSGRIDEEVEDLGEARVIQFGQRLGFALEVALGLGAVAGVGLLHPQPLDHHRAVEQLLVAGQVDIARAALAQPLLDLVAVIVQEHARLQRRRDQRLGGGEGAPAVGAERGARPHRVAAIRALRGCQQVRRLSVVSSQ